MTTVLFFHLVHGPSYCHKHSIFRDSMHHPKPWRLQVWQFVLSSSVHTFLLLNPKHTKFPCCGYTFRCHLWTMWFMFAWWGWQENASVHKFCFLADDDNYRIYSLMWPVNHGHAQYMSHSLFNSVNTWGNENSRTLSLWNFRLLPQCSRDLQSPDLLSSIGCLSMMFWGSILVLSWPSETRLMCCLKSSVTNQPVLENPEEQR